MSGMRYGGSSKRKVEPFDLKTVEPRPLATTMAMTHVRNGVTRMETMRSFSESSARAPMMAGTPQPKPIISGMTPLPVRPQRRMIGSMMKAMRAM